MAGGRFYERDTDGQEFDVGRLLLCEPPRRIVFTWQGGWSALHRIPFMNGWPTVFGRYREAAGAIETR